MAPDEYWSERGKLGTALRSLRWERRAIQDIFRATTDPVLRAQGCVWVQAIVIQDVAICRRIQALDVRFQLES